MNHPAGGFGMGGGTGAAAGGNGNGNGRNGKGGAGNGNGGGGGNGGANGQQKHSPPSVVGVKIIIVFLFYSHIFLRFLDHYFFVTLFFSQSFTIPLRIKAIQPKDDILNFRGRSHYLTFLPNIV